VRTREEQRAGLHKLAHRAMHQQVNVALEDVPGDVVSLTPLYYTEPPSRLEVVYADANGAYDLWQGGHLVQVDLTEDEAVQALVNEYNRYRPGRG
jgi:hypothetical protein